MTIFIIVVLGMMAALAVMQGLDQFATLAATAAGYVLVNKFIWVISPPWVGSWFWAVWFIAFVVAIVAHFRNGMRAAAFAAAIGVLAVVFAGLVPATIASQTVTAAQATIEVGETDQEGGDETPMAAGAEVQAKAPAGTGGAVEACAPDNVQQWPDAVNNRLVPAGLWSADGKAATTAEIADANQRAAVGADARYLAEMAWYEGLWDSPSNWASLITVDKSCLSDQGQTLKAELFDKWDSATPSLVQDGSGYNTGRTADGQFVQAKVAGITGDITTLLRNYESHSSQTLVRCGNPKLEGPGKPAARPDKTMTPPVSSPKPTETETPKPTPTETETPKPTTPPCPYIPEIPEDHPDCKEKEGEEAPDPVEGHDGPHGDPPGEPETEQPEQPAPADPSVAPGSPDPSIEVPTAEETTEETEEQAEPAPTSTQGPTHEPTGSATPVTPNHTEDSNSDEVIVTDEEPPPFGDINDLAGAGAAGALLIPLLRRKRQH